MIFHQAIDIWSVGCVLAEMLAGARARPHMPSSEAHSKRQGDHFFPAAITITSYPSS
jgi:serine/threonine protein kinase